MNYNNSLSLWNFDEYFLKMSREDERSRYPVGELIWDRRVA
jgi:hypothetical protein